MAGNGRFGSKMIRIDITIPPALFTLPQRLESATLDARNATAERARGNVGQSLRDVGRFVTGETARRAELVQGETEDEVILHNPTPADILEVGRRPNRPPPPQEALRPWAAAVGFVGSLFLLARKIGRDGIEGRFPYKKAWERTTQEMPAIVNSLLDSVR